MSSFVSGSNNPYELITERLINYPKKAKYIQLERSLLEDFLREYEEMEAELAEFREDIE